MAELIDLDICSSPTGEVVKVTDNPRAYLMFYVHCISNVLDLSDYHADIVKLRDYENFHLLTDKDIDDLLILCVQMYPAILIDKCIILNDRACGNYENKYTDLEEAIQEYPVVESMTIAKVEYKVIRAMYFTCFRNKCFKHVKRYYFLLRDGETEVGMGAKEFSKVFSILEVCRFLVTSKKRSKSLIG